jgi:hypothetical protein
MDTSASGSGKPTDAPVPVRDLLSYLARKPGLEFPVVIIPLGAERDDTNCYKIASVGGLTSEIIQDLEESSFPLDGVPSVQLIPTSGNSTWDSVPLGVPIPYRRDRTAR